ncbi:NAD(P)H-binding protein [Leifsonia bigeumensis]|uniref:NAD(P)H-binding protein n=1 Tax=Leifsonella bigeumensis TaxID=433643 RepID=A0ABP7FIH1_9MICO
MSTILVTGATGTLGTPTVARLREAGHDVRALSRTSGPGLTTGDLLTGDGIPAAIAGVDAVMHLATGVQDVAQGKAAIGAARAAAVEHFILISIVGIEDIPLGYYRGKVEIEKTLVASGIPHTILRATQFHQFVNAIFAGTKYSPVILVPRFSFQPISTDEVAVRLVELAGADASGRVADIGGPEQRTARDLAEAWKRATGSRRAIWNIRMPGKTAAGYAAGHNLVPGTPYGVVTFDDYLAAKYQRGTGEK